MKNAWRAQKYDISPNHRQPIPAKPQVVDRTRHSMKAKAWAGAIAEALQFRAPPEGKPPKNGSTMY